MSKIDTAFESFLLWYSCVELIPVELEFSVYDHKRRVAGTCDCLCYLRWAEKNIDNYYYLDWKTGTYINRNNHGAQIAQYKRSDGRYPKAGIGVLYLSKEEPDFKFFDATRFEKRYLKRFDLASDLFFLDRPRIAKKAGR